VGRAVVATVVAVGILAALGGPAAYAVQTAATPHTGSIPSAGPTVAGGTGFGPGGGRGGLAGGRPTGTPPAGGFTPPGGATGGTAGGTAGGTTGGTTGRPTRAFGGGMGGLLDAATPSPQLVATLEQDAGSYTWAAAAVGSNNSAGYQLATGDPVLPIGGFNGSDPSPTLAQFQQYVASGQVHWFIGGGLGMRSDGGSSASSEIAAWVEQNFTARTVDGVTLYDLSGGAAG
jgi:hypothetical protein